KKLTRPIATDALHSRLNCGTSTSAPAWNVRTIPANEPRKPSQPGTSTWKALPTITPASSSISATESPTSTLIVDATRIVPARSAATAMSLNLYLLETAVQLVEAIGGSTAVGRGP